MTNQPRYMTNALSERIDAYAPDGSEIRVLGNTERGSMAHGTLPPGAVSHAVVHGNVEEMWYALSGRAELWRSLDGIEQVVDLRPGSFVTIPVGTRFQFRTIGAKPFRFLMCTMPPWPPEGDASRVPGHWPVSEVVAF